MLLGVVDAGRSGYWGRCGLIGMWKGWGIEVGKMWEGRDIGIEVG